MTQTTEQDVFLIDQLPFGVVEDMKEFLFDSGQTAQDLLNEEVINEFVAEGLMLNFKQYFYTGVDQAFKRYDLHIRLEQIAVELLAQHGADVRYWLEKSAQIVKDTCKLTYVTVEEDVMVLFPTGTFKTLYEGEEYDFIGVVETDEDTLILVVDNETGLPFLVDAQFLTIHEIGE